jgi:hypothetical protein
LAPPNGRYPTGLPENPSKVWAHNVSGVPQRWLLNDPPPLARFPFGQPRTSARFLATTSQDLKPYTPPNPHHGLGDAKTMINPDADITELRSPVVTDLTS